MAMFELRDAIDCMILEHLGQRSVIDFVVVSLDIRPQVLDTCVNIGTVLSTDRPGDELIQMVRSIARQAWQAQIGSEDVLGTCNVLSGQISAPTSKDFSVFWQVLGMWNPNEPCSKPIIKVTARKAETSHARPCGNSRTCWWTPVVREAVKLKYVLCAWLA